MFRSSSVPLGDPSELATAYLPFAPTQAQIRALAEIVQDLAQSTPMVRLLQGDVGAGKTAVAAVAARHVIEHGWQVAVMAPTEILAEQLYRVFCQYFPDRANQMALLSAHTPAKERQALTERLALGDILLLVGTHALLNEQVRFRNLGLCIIDEQHRFGVEQRAALYEKGAHSDGLLPHLLVMTATPIPRSLALTLYGDLALSTLDERPPGRKPILTKILRGHPLESLLKVAERIIETKQKAYVVFPLIEDSETLDLENAINGHATLQNIFGEQAIGLLHGRMKGAAKQTVIQDFREGTLRILISTSVVEVGVDVPDATCMLIMHPERFGIAQLHQLRGRVGRKDLQSYCFLLTDLSDQDTVANQRLCALCETNDGFVLAQKDLDIRGPGEYLGTRQSGMAHFRIFNFTNYTDLIEPAKRYSEQLLTYSHAKAHEHLFQGKPSFNIS